jgi:putative transposase
MKQAHEYRHDEPRVHLILSHLIWCPRRRRPVLAGPVAQRCRALRESQCAEKPWEVLALAVQPVSVHLLVRVSPAERAAEVKGAGSAFGESRRWLGR